MTVAVAESGTGGRGVHARADGPRRWPKLQLRPARIVYRRIASLSPFERAAAPTQRGTTQRTSSRSLPIMAQSSKQWPKADACRSIEGQIK